MSNCNENEELRLLFQINIEELRYCKMQQWHTLYVTLLAIGGLISLVLALKSPTFGLKEFLIIICWSVSVIGIVFVFVYYYSIKDFRSTKLKIINKFSSETKKISDISADDNADSNYRDLMITIAFSSIIFLAAVLAHWLILISSVQ
jgi:hypothetical protein